MSSQPFNKQVDAPKAYDIPKNKIPAPIVKPSVQNHKIIKQEIFDD